MYTKAASPVQDISFGEALNVSLNNYYDLLKASVGGLAANEYLQLKLVADPVSLNDQKASAGGYRWWSYWNLIERSDHAISPTPIDSQVQVSALKLADIYGQFLDVLIGYVALKNLSSQDQNDLADIGMKIRSLIEINEKLTIDDQMRWKRYADLMGYAYGDRSQYLRWAQRNGNSTEIENNNIQLDVQAGRRKTILNKQYSHPDDKTIVAASALFDSQTIQMAYPIHPDYTYEDGDQFSPSYLSRLGGTITGMFDSRRVISWQMTIADILKMKAGEFSATFDKTTGKSTSIVTDWSASGSGGWGFIRASASTSSHTEIQEDFKKALNVKLAAKSAFRVNIIYPAWFQASLFSCVHVAENPKAFIRFFGDKGSLLYYPTALLLVRGFSVAFESSQDWKYDYKNNFSAGGGGGFSAFGFNFGAKANYSQQTKEHQVDQSNTKLTFGDDENTIRFVGFAVAKNVKFSTLVDEAIEKSLGKAHFDTLDN